MLETDLLLSEISGLQKKKADLESQVMQQNIDFLVIKQRLEGPLMIEQEVDEKLRSDPRMLVWQNQLIEMQLRSGQSGGRQEGLVPEGIAVSKAKWRKSARHERLSYSAHQTVDQRKTPLAQPDAATVYQRSEPHVERWKTTIGPARKDLGRATEEA